MNDILRTFNADPGLFDPAAFEQSLQDSNSFLITVKNTLKQGQQELDRRFKEGTDVHALVHGRAWMLDQLLVRVWQEYQWPAGNIVSLSLWAAMDEVSYTPILIST